METRLSNMERLEKSNGWTVQQQQLVAEMLYKRISKRTSKLQRRDMRPWAGNMVGMVLRMDKQQLPMLRYNKATRPWTTSLWSLWKRASS